ncbi:hypothetical protein GGTG_09948 [Gaeumannomyces tritici R3-111a-1]|uniref:Uncharacterized protein n=1 Tax=Gaeumannomyces tritici (strain R3-111a-1) TaxID=644352 RepID=J3P8W4_GAET3|nr:hypothetical protein GGTG_09948 [Gaeumannomyces tritici R3-111a-1]EJT73098.1 hypothetical protein GGTG_09948 [Gaeumannomyces tritici R3-111a-1]
MLSELHVFICSLWHGSSLRMWLMQRVGGPLAWPMSSACQAGSLWRPFLGDACSDLGAAASSLPSPTPVPLGPGVLGRHSVSPPHAPSAGSGKSQQQTPSLQQTPDAALAASAGVVLVDGRGTPPKAVMTTV